MNKFEVQIAFNGETENTSYKSYANEKFVKLNFVKTINSNNSKPNFDINKSDGEVEIIDSDLAILERIKNNDIKNYFLTKVFLNGNQIGKFIGVNANYPYNSKSLTYELDDWGSYLEQFSCVEFYLNNNIIDGNALLNELKMFSNIVISEEDFDLFEVTSTSLSNYLKDFTFVCPYIKCKNLKELWETFLNATMTTMFCNSKGLFELQNYFDYSKDVIAINKSQVGQRIDLNLIPNNNISKVTVNYKGISPELTNYYNSYLPIMSNDKIINEQELEIPRTYSDDIEKYLTFLGGNEFGTLQVKEPSLYYKFFEHKTKTATRMISFDNAQPSRYQTLEENILAESFIDLKDNIYNQNFSVNQLFKFFYTAYGQFRPSNIIPSMNYVPNYEYKLKVQVLTDDEYRNLTIDKMGFDTIYMSPYAWITPTGRKFKSLIPMFYVIKENRNNRDWMYSLSFNSQENKIFGQSSNNMSNSYFETYDINLNKSELSIPYSELIFINNNDKNAKDSFNTYSELVQNSLNLGELALVLKDETHNNKSTIYKYLGSSQYSDNWEFVDYNNCARYKGEKLNEYIAKNIYNHYKNGKQTIIFETSNYDFIDVDGKRVYSGNNGEILQVGDLVKLISVSSKTFKITKILGSYDGALNLLINAVEI